MDVANTMENETITTSGRKNLIKLLEVNLNVENLNKTIIETIVTPVGSHM
jgi:hypothetical protein